MDAMGKPLRYAAQPERDQVLTVEADDPSNNYDNYNEEMVKRYPIIETGLDTGATEEDDPFVDTLTLDRVKVRDLIEAWPHLKSAMKNHDGRKVTHDFYTLTGVSTCTRTSLNKPTVL